MKPYLTVLMALAVVWSSCSQFDDIPFGTDEALFEDDRLDGENAETGTQSDSNTLDEGEPDVDLTVDPVQDEPPTDPDRDDTPADPLEDEATRSFRTWRQSSGHDHFHDSLPAGKPAGPASRLQRPPRVQERSQWLKF